MKMSDINESENNVDQPLLKQKKTRPPQSEKQKEAFQKAAAKRAENIKSRKDDKLLNAQKALLEKEGYVKAPKNVPVQKQEVQFEIDEVASESEQEPEPEPVRKPLSKKEKPPQQQQAVPKSKAQKKAPIIMSESESGDEDSSSDEEVIVIKRTRKSKMKPKPLQYIEEEEENNMPILTDWGKYFN
jgi:hypothetical protein